MPLSTAASQVVNSNTSAVQVQSSSKQHFALLHQSSDRLRTLPASFSLGRDPVFTRLGHSKSTTSAQHSSRTRSRDRSPSADKSDPRRLSRRLNFLSRPHTSEPETLAAADSQHNNPNLSPKLQRSSSSHLNLRKATSGISRSRERKDASAAQPEEDASLNGQAPGSAESTSADPTTTTGETLPGTTSTTASAVTGSTDQRTSLFKTETDTSSRATQASGASDRDRKMHQTSSRLLRMTDEERPFSRVSGCSFVLDGCYMPLSPPPVCDRLSVT
jgi:hypothetical protein